MYETAHCIAKTSILLTNIVFNHYSFSRIQKIELTEKEDNSECTMTGDKSTKVNATIDYFSRFVSRVALACHKQHSKDILPSHPIPLFISSARTLSSN